MTRCGVNRGKPIARIPVILETLSLKAQAAYRAVSMPR